MGRVATAETTAKKPKLGGLVGYSKNLPEAAETAKNPKLETAKKRTLGRSVSYNKNLPEAAETAKKPKLETAKKPKRLRVREVLAFLVRVPFGEGSFAFVLGRIRVGIFRSVSGRARNC